MAQVRAFRVEKLIARSVSKPDVNRTFFDKLNTVLGNVGDYKKLEFDAVGSGPVGKCPLANNA